MSLLDLKALIYESNLDYGMKYLLMKCRKKEIIIRFLVEVDKMQVPQEYQGVIKNAADSNKIPFNLLAALLYHESNFNPNCKFINKDGSIDRGIAQINNKAHPEISDAQAYDSNFAIHWAANYLANLYKQYNNWWETLLAYNGGHGAVIASRQGHPYNAQYADSIFKISNLKTYADEIQAAINHLGNIWGLDMCEEHKQWLHDVANHLRNYMGWPEK